jgi:serine/threonine protein kinase
MTNILNKGKEIYRNADSQPLLLQNFEVTRILKNSEFSVNCVIYNSIYETNLFLRIIKKWTSYNTSVENIRSYASVFENFANLKEESISQIEIMIDHPAFFIIIMPLYHMGNIYEYIYKTTPRKQTLSEKAVFIIALKMLNVMKTVHKESKVLMCLKPENIYFMSKKQIKLVHLTKSKLDFQNYAENIISEDIEYLPPELIKNDLEIGSGVDYWQLGILLLFK